jgi:Heavy metal binding domain
MRFGMRSYQAKTALYTDLRFSVAVLAACSKPAILVTQADADYWTCAMHPSVHSQTPGKCPICGMDLIPVSAVRSEPKRNADSIKSASASNSRCGRLIYLGQPRQYRVNRVWVPVDYFNGVASAF